MKSGLTRPLRALNTAMAKGTSIAWALRINSCTSSKNSGNSRYPIRSEELALANTASMFSFSNLRTGCDWIDLSTLGQRPMFMSL